MLHKECYEATQNSFFRMRIFHFYYKLRGLNLFFIVLKIFTMLYIIIQNKKSYENQNSTTGEDNLKVPIHFILVIITYRL